jgi:hypothetical protein
MSSAMKKNQLTLGQERRVMYVENKNGLINGVQARIGWVTFSKTGRTIYYEGRSLKALGGRGIQGNFYDEESNEEFWISGVKKRGSNTHITKSITPVVDEDAQDEYERLKLE